MKMIFSQPRHLLIGINLFLLMLWVALIPLSAFAVTPHRSTPDFATIDAYVLSQMRSLHIPGVALGIVHGNQVVHLRGFGTSDPTGRRVTPQTTFAISSMTKSFTAVAIMQLVEQTKVTLDAPESSCSHCLHCGLRSGLYRGGGSRSSAHQPVCSGGLSCRCSGKWHCRLDSLLRFQSWQERPGQSPCSTCRTLASG